VAAEYTRALQHVRKSDIGIPDARDAPDRGFRGRRRDGRTAGRTTIGPGTNLTVHLRSSNAEQPFLLSNETTVREDGRFAATFDLAEMPDGTTATLSIRSGGDELAEAPVRLVAERTPTPTESQTPPPTGVPTDSPSPSATSSGDGPGVGALVAFAVALGTALVLGRRA